MTDRKKEAADIIPGMSLQFSRSLRALRVDSFRSARIGMFLAILIMIGLLAWFTLAKVTIFENSNAIRFTEDGRLVATFSSEGINRVRQGQAAILRVSLGQDQPAIALPALVYQLEPDSDEAQVMVLGGEIPENLRSGKLSGRVEVEVEYLTPAQLLLRASGKYLGNNEIPISPQNLQGEG